MSISRDNMTLFQAIMAMDTYNRGYNSGIMQGIVGLGGEGSQLGLATVIKQDGLQNAQAISFFAQAYTLNGKTIIAYRGTDQSGPDIANGYGTGLGAVLDTQARMAIEFYRSVVGAGNERTADVVLTGHSMGGGHAGLIAALYGKQGVLFDAMPFAGSARNTYADALLHGQVIYEGTPYTSQADALVYQGAPFAPVIGANITNTYIPAPWLNPGSNWLGFGRDLLLGGTGANQIAFQLPTDAPLDWTNYNFVGERHDGALLVIRMFLGGSDLAGAGPWANVARSVLPALFSQAIGEASGAGPFRGSGALSDFSNAMRTAIAYSAIDEGERPFGDTAVRALLNDANEMGSLGSHLDLMPLLERGLAEIVVQHAGHLALSRTFLETDPSVVQGVLNLTGEAFFADIRQPLFGPGPILGLSNVMRGASVASGLEQDALSSMVEALQGGLNALERIGVMQQNLHAVTPGLRTITIGTVGGDRISGNELADVLVGGGGDDVLEGDEGNDLILGGAGADTAVYGDEGGDATVTLSLQRATVVREPETDTLHSIEQLRFGAGADTVRFINTQPGYQAGAIHMTLDGGAQSDGALDLIDLSGMDGLETGIVIESDGTAFYPATFRNFESLVATKGRDLITLGDTGALSSIRHVNGHEGDDEIRLTGTTAGIEADGGAGRDLLVGSAQADILRGGADADRLIGGLGADVIDGGAGIDTADYSGSASRIYVNLDEGEVRGLEGALNEADGDVLSSIENVIGTAFNDRIEGDGAGNRLEGGAGVDRIRGGGGNDHLMGGESGPLIGSEHLDVAIYSGRWIDYAINRTVPGSEQFTVTDRRDGTPEGADLVDQFEFFVFEGDGPGTAVRATFVENVAPVRIDLVSGGSLAEGSYGAGTTIASFQWEDRNAYDQVRSWSASGFASGTIAAIDDLFQVAWDAGTGLMSLQFARDVTLDFESWSSRVANWAQWANGSFAGSVPALALAGTAYGASLTVTDWGGLSLSRSFAFQVTDIDETPVFSLPSQDDGDGDAALRTFRVAENTLDVGSVAAVSGVSGQAVTYSLEGADAARFEIDATGQIRFGTAPDFEQPSDAGSDNAYDLVVRATAAQTSATQAVRVIVDNVNEAPVFADSAPLAVALPENSMTPIAILQAVDPDAGDVLRYAISGDDAFRFDVDPLTGAITSRAPLDFENRQDVDGDGVYRLTLAATDQGGLTATRDVAVTVTDVNESPFAIRWASGGSVPEHSRPGILVGQVIASDHEGGPIAFSLAAPNDRFTITPEGRIWTASANPLALDFETAASETIAIRATDAGGLSTVMTLAVSVTNVAETRIVLTDANNSWFTSSNAVHIVEARGGNDTLVASSGNDILIGENDNDSLNGGSGSDWLIGGSGADRMDGGDGDDLLDGGTDNDTMTGGNGNDRIFGGAGDDLIIAGPGADAIDGGVGRDIVDYSSATTAMTFDHRTGQAFGGLSSDDVLANVEGFIGGAGADTFIGSDGIDVMNGGRGVDTYLSSAGADRISDVDAAVLDFRNSNAGVSFASNGQTWTGTGGTAQGDLITVSGHATIHGSEFSDVLIGRHHHPSNGTITTPVFGHETIFGYGGDDSIDGYAGSHIIDGGDGNDTLRGWGGYNDTFIGGAGFDVIMPGSGNDVIDFGSGGGRLTFKDYYGYQVWFDFETGVLEHRSGSGTSQVVNSTAIVTGDFNEFEGGVYNDRVFGSSRAEVIRGFGQGTDYFDGRGGNDTLEGYGTLIGGAGDDDITFRGGLMADGGEGNDTINANTAHPSAGDVMVYGGSGDDTITSTSSGIRIDGGLGADRISGNGWTKLTYEASTSAISLVNGAGTGGDAEGDIVSGIGTIYGSAFGDTITGTFRDYVYAGAGDDVMDVFNGYGVFGGSGNDHITSRWNAPTYGESGNDFFVQFAGNAYGGEGDDTFHSSGGSALGDAGNDTFLGIGNTVNSFTGGEGNDVFRGGLGSDFITMNGSDWDIAYWRRGDGTDTIQNFTIGTDKIVIERGSLLDPMPTFRFLAEGATSTSMELTFLNAGQSPSSVSQSNRHYLTFTGITPNMLSADDFIFM
jgi:Ca2+-binding RTX toxin-like protein